MCIYEFSDSNGIVLSKKGTGVSADIWIEKETSERACLFGVFLENDSCVMYGWCDLCYCLWCLFDYIIKCTVLWYGAYGSYDKWNGDVLFGVCLYFGLGFYEEGYCAIDNGIKRFILFFSLWACYN